MSLPREGQQLAPGAATPPMPDGVPATPKPRRFVENEQLENWFGYHQPSSPAIAEAHDFVRREALELAFMFNALLLECPEKTLALRKLREASMWANGAIACNQKIGKRPWLARLTSVTVTPQAEPEIVYVNVLADPRTVAELGHWIGECVGEAVSEVFGSLTPEQRSRFEAAVNAAMQKTVDARDLFDREGIWPDRGGEADVEA